MKEIRGLNEVRKFYRMISEARKGFTLTINMCKAKDRTMLGDQQDVLHCLVEQFTQQLDGFKISEINTRNERFTVTTVEMVMNVPTQLEINTAITNLQK